MKITVEAKEPKAIPPRTYPWVGKSAMGRVVLFLHGSSSLCLLSPLPREVGSTENQWAEISFEPHDCTVTFEN